MRRLSVTIIRSGSINIEARCPCAALPKSAAGLLFINLHPREQGAVEEMRVHYPDINFVAPGTDIFPIAKFTDCLSDRIIPPTGVRFPLCRQAGDFLPARSSRLHRTDAQALLPKLYSESFGRTRSRTKIENLIAAVADVFRSARIWTFSAMRATLLRKKLFDYQDGKAGRALLHGPPTQSRARNSLCPRNVIGF